MAGEDDAGRHVAERPDRGANPFLILLFVPVIAVAGFLVAILILPPIAGAAFGIDRVDAKLTALGADFTHVPRFPERSTIYAADGETVPANSELFEHDPMRLGSAPAEPASEAGVTVPPQPTAASPGEPPSRS